MTQTGYCPHCKQQVLLVREKMDVCLAFILLIFTAGVGFIIYLIYYYSKPENRCIHCYTLVQSAMTTQYTPSTEKLPYQEQSYQIPTNYREKRGTNREYVSVESTVGRTEILNCPYCGARIESKSQKFCTNCASRLN